MKPNFHHRPVNGPFEDPAVFVRILRDRRALLFDAGDVSGLSTRDLMKLTDVFVTHTHIDHFIGFDTIIRILLRRDTPVTFYGPEGIIDRIQGKLRGYTWNLITEYPLVIRVLEIRNENVHKATFKAGERFELNDEGTQDNKGSVLDNPLFSVNAVVLEHDVPSLGFSIKEKIHINIDKTKLTDRGLEVGPWLNTLKDSIRNGKFDECIDTGKGIYKVSELENIYLTTEGQKLSYVMDSSPTDDNFEKIVEFVSDADSLYIEAYFMHKDLEHAFTRNHLTAKLAGLIAKKARVKNLHLLHFSPRYRDRAEDIINEAYEGFGC
jgi:ribonuclease Z